MSNLNTVFKAFAEEEELIPEKGYSFIDGNTNVPIELLSLVEKEEPKNVLYVLLLPVKRADAKHKTILMATLQKPMLKQASDEENNTSNIATRRSEFYLHISDEDVLMIYYNDAHGVACAQSYEEFSAYSPMKISLVGASVLMSLLLKVKL